MMMRIHFVVSIAASLVLFVGCGSNDSDGGGSSGSGGGGQQCNDLSASIPKVEMQQKAESAPEALGGTLKEGLYVATAHTLYTGPGGKTGPNGESHRSALRLTGITSGMGQKGSYQWLYDDYRTAGTFSNNGSSVFSEEETCPPPEPGAYTVPSYTVSGDDILFFISPVWVVTLTKR